MSSLKLKLLDDYVLVCVLKSGSVSKSGIILPDSSEKSQIAQVLSVGPGKFDPTSQKRMPMDICVGDQVLLRKHAGIDVSKYDIESCIDIPTNCERLAIIRVTDALLVFQK